MLPASASYGTRVKPRVAAKKEQRAIKTILHWCIRSQLLSAHKEEAGADEKVGVTRIDELVK